MMRSRPLDLTSPIMNAAGSLGFAPDIRETRVDFSKLGLFVSNPITYGPHTPARQRSFVPYPGGFFMHTGLPNLGLRKVLRKYESQWLKSSSPLMLHLIGKSPAELEKMVLLVEEQGIASAIELGIHADVDAGFVREMVSAALGELPIVVRLPLNRASDLASAVSQAEVSAISLGPPRGAFPTKNGDLQEGRLYGPGLFPQSLAAVKAIVAMDIPVIGGVGIYENEQVEQMLEAGALGVQLDSALWNNHNRIFMK